MDLWSYKDDYIQPIQKVRAARDRDRTFTAVYSIPDRKMVQLADEEMETVTPSESAQWVLGSDDREYRRLADFDERYSDEYVVDAATGKRKLVAKKAHGAAHMVAQRRLSAHLRRQGLEHHFGAGWKDRQPDRQPAGEVLE